jgi:hypothetical protein
MKVEKSHLEMDGEYLDRWVRLAETLPVKKAFDFATLSALSQVRLNTI